MYKALNYWVFGGFDGQKTPYEFIDFAKAQNLDGVELTVGDALDINISQDECKAIRQYADAQGIGLKTLASGAFWNLSLASVDESVRQQAVAFGKKYLQIAAWLGVEAILVIPGATRVAWEPDLPVFSYRQAWEQSVKSLQELLPVAEVCQVTIALENVWNRFCCRPWNGSFIWISSSPTELGCISILATAVCSVDLRITSKFSVPGLRQFMLRTFRKTTAPAVSTASAMISKWDRWTSPPYFRKWPDRT